MLPGFGVAVIPNGLDAMGTTHPPYNPPVFLGELGPYEGALSPASHRKLMQSPRNALPYASSGFPGIGGSHLFDRCTGGNCGYWGGCHGGHCGEFYDFRPCHTPECFDGPIHGFDCMDGSCKRVCNGPNCQDFIIRGCSGKGSPIPDHGDNNVSNGNGKN